MSIALDRVLGKLEGVKKSRDGFKAFCPLHEADGNGHRQSLSIAHKDGAVGLHCFGGCDKEAVLAAIGLTFADLFDEPKAGSKTRAKTTTGKLGPIVATYPYHDWDGTLLHETTRHDPKDFRHRRPDGSGGRLWNLDGVERVLFGLPELIDQADVFLAEGEEDSKALRAIGLVATTSCGGAKGWGKGQYAEQLVKAGCLRLTVLPDNDDAGRRYAEQVAESCTEAGVVCRVVTLPGLPEKEDVRWWLEHGHTREELLALVDAAPVWTPAESPEPETEAADTSDAGLPADSLSDAVDVALEGRRIAEEGIPYAVFGIIPLLGILGFLVAFAKVGKTTFGQALAAAVAMGRRFLERETTRLRVLVIAAEDPPEYVAWLARHLAVERGWMTFFRGPILLTPAGLARICHTVKAGNYGLVLIASWQAVIRGLVRDENDNAGAVCVVEAVKAAARTSGVPWLIDAHSGKGEDQADDADPSRAMRGASAAAGAADYSLSLRYANGAFGTQRKLSGRGRFVSLEPIVIDFDGETGEFTVLGCSKSAAAETTWRLIRETDAIATEPRTAGAIAQSAGMVGADGIPTKTHKRQVALALANRDGVLRSEEVRRGGKTWLYRLATEVEP